MSKLKLALLWHQHKPIYKDVLHKSAKGSYRFPYVRLHSVRDYYSMAAIVARYPNVHLTINLTPCLLWQIEDYTKRGATDRSQELSLKSAETLSSVEREEILSSFFDAQWHNQIYPHPRYAELFTQRAEKLPFSTQDIRDLQVWSNLAWFGQEFRQKEIELITGETVRIYELVKKALDFTTSEVEKVISEQLKIMQAIIPLHRYLQESGQIEVSTTPFFHPILPLLVDTDRATIDRPGATFPNRFNYPQDAAAQVDLAVDFYIKRFGREPRGMWAAEGTVSQFVIPFFAHRSIDWIASDGGVLARSGRFGYDIEKPDVLCQPYRAEEDDFALSIFFRDSKLSDAIGFRFQNFTDQKQAARQFLDEIKERFARRLEFAGDRVLTVVLDGENAWGAYPDDGREFLCALYDFLANDDEIQTVTFSEFLDGNEAREIEPHPLEKQTKVYELFTGSWIDENGSFPGADLGTWIGEAEENQAWNLLVEARAFLESKNATSQNAPAAFESLYIAEGSDWFWWYGEDQDSGHDEDFDRLFRRHLQNIYLALFAEPPENFYKAITAESVVWSFTSQTQFIRHLDGLVFQTNCPGILTWQVDEAEPQTESLAMVGGTMAGAQRFQLMMRDFPLNARQVRFRFECKHLNCDYGSVCCSTKTYKVDFI